MTHNRRHVTQFLVGAALTLLAGALLAAEARATCGDYVMLGTNTAHRGNTAKDSPSPNLPVRIPHDSHNEQKPCSGPFCSRAPSSLPLSPAPVAPVRAEQWGWLVNAPIAASTDPSFLAFNDGLDRPVCHVLSIYHPPR